MTQRERLSLILTGGGAFALVVAATAYGGWVLGLAVLGSLSLVSGFLLGFEDEDADPDFMTPSFLGEGP